MLSQAQRTLRAWLPLPELIYAFIRFLGQTSISISLSALGITCAAAFLFGKAPTWEVALLPFLCTYCVYNFDRLADSSGADSQSTPDRARILKLHLRWMRFSVAAAFVAMVALALSSGLLTLLITLAFPLAGVLYVLPLLRFGGIRRLKDVPLLKSFYVPACWCLLVVLAIHLGQIPWSHPATLFIFAFVYLRIFLGAYLGDLRDLEADLSVGVRTLAGFLGLARSIRLLTALHLLLTPVLVAGAVWAAWVPPLTMALIPACALGYGTFRLFLARPEQREFLGNFYDLEYISYFVLLQLGGLLLPVA